MALEENRVQPGQHVSRAMKAETWNSLVELARRDRLRRLGQQAGPVGSSLTPSVDCLVRNDTGSNVSQGYCLAITGALLDPAGEPLDFLDRPVFSGDVPSSAPLPTDALCVLLEPAGPDELARAVLLGVAQVQLAVSDTAHLYALATASDATLMASGTAGPARILWTETGATGNQAAVVLMEGAGAAATGGRAPWLRNSATLTTSTTNNLVPPALSTLGDPDWANAVGVTYYLFGTSGPYKLTGLVSTSWGGTVPVSVPIGISNETSAGFGNPSPLTLAHDDSGSTATNRFNFPGSTGAQQDWLVQPGETAWVYYDGTRFRRWDDSQTVRTIAAVAGTYPADATDFAYCPSTQVIDTTNGLTLRQGLPPSGTTSGVLTLGLTAASTSVPGAVTTGGQSFIGQKIFTSGARVIGPLEFVVSLGISPLGEIEQLGGGFWHLRTSSASTYAGYPANDLYLSPGLLEIIYDVPTASVPAFSGIRLTAHRQDGYTASVDGDTGTDGIGNVFQSGLCVSVSTVASVTLTPGTTPVSGATAGALLVVDAAGALLAEVVPSTAGLPLLSSGPGATPDYGQVGTAGIAVAAVTLPKIDPVAASLIAQRGLFL